MGVLVTVQVVDHDSRIRKGGKLAFYLGTYFQSQRGVRAVRKQSPGGFFPEKASIRSHEQACIGTESFAL